MATMAGTAQEAVRGIMEGPKPYKFRSLKLSMVDFSGLDLEHADFRNASVPYANFSKCKLRYANFENANCFGANFDQADLHRANFKDAVLSDAIMTASDMFGVTLTMECRSFQGMRLAPGHWWGFLFYGLLMKPPSPEAEEALIKAMGVERYTVLREQYVRRRI